jgi:tetratricopeptide (TPR) repeat protein
MKPGRNDPCPCGSGRKFKQCCGQAAPAQESKPQRQAGNQRMPTPAAFAELAALLAAGRYVELERQSRALTERYPASGPAWKALGVALKMQAQDPVPALERAAALMPQDAEAQANLGIALLEAQRVNEALARLRQALVIKPGYAEVHNVLGCVQLDHGRPEQAGTCFRNAIAIKPDYVDAHNNLGNALLQLGRFDEAAQSYRQALALKPDYAEVHNNLGNALLDAGHLEQALASYRRSLELKPQFAEVHGSLGNALMRLGRLEEAAASFRSALAIKPENAVLLSSLSNALLHLGHSEDAAASARRALAIKPDLAEAHAHLGAASLDLGRADAAAASFQRALAIRPDYPEALNNLGNALRSLGRYDQAIASYRRALALQPAFADAHNNLGIALRLQGNTAEAEESGRRALEINPDALAAIINLAEARADQGDFAAAEAMFSRAIALQPDLVEAWTGIARVRRMTAADTSWLETAMRLEQQPLRPRQAVALHYAIGKYFDDVGDFDRAFDHYSRANEFTKRQTEGYDPRRLRQAVDELIQIYDRAWLEQAQVCAVASTRPVFIVGMPRSGTSLVEQILASHPQVFGAGEQIFWSDASGAVQAAAREGGAAADLASRLARDYLQLLQNLSADALRVTDKMPGNFMYLGLIRAVLPGSRIIHVRRDPVDTCLSIYFQDFGTALAYANDLGDLAHYYGEYRRIMRHWQSILREGAMLEVPYEALIADQESLSRKLLEFLDLPWDPRCLDFHETARSVVTTSRWQVRQKISARSVGRWRNYTRHVAPLLPLLSLAADTD